MRVGVGRVLLLILEKGKKRKASDDPLPVNNISTERDREMMEGLGFRSRTSTSTENIINPKINKEDPRHDSSIDFD